MEEDYIDGQYVTWNISSKDHTDGRHMTEITVRKYTKYIQVIITYYSNKFADQNILDYFKLKKKMIG